MNLFLFCAPRTAVLFRDSLLFARTRFQARAFCVKLVFNGCAQCRGTPPLVIAGAYGRAGCAPVMRRTAGLPVDTAAGSAEQRPSYMRRLHSPSVRLRFKDTAAGTRKELARCLVFAAGKREKNARQEPGAQSGVCNSRRIRAGLCFIQNGRSSALLCADRRARLKRAEKLFRLFVLPLRSGAIAQHRGRP